MLTKSKVNKQAKFAVNTLIKVEVNSTNTLKTINLKTENNCM